MKINGISYWIKDGKCEMLNLDEGLKVLRIPAFMDKVNGEIIGLCGTVEKFVVEEGNQNYYVQGNCLISKAGELLAGAADSVIPTDGSITRIGNMAFLHKAPECLVIPDGVKSIGYRAFAESRNLRSVGIPESVTEINAAFERCDNLRSVVFDGSQEQWNRLLKEKKFVSFDKDIRVNCRFEEETEYEIVQTIFTCEQGFERAICATLGKKREYLVVKDGEAALRLIKRIKTGEVKNTTILPLDMIQPKNESEEIETALKEKGVVGRAEDIVFVRKSYEPLVKHLFGNTIVCDTIENAVKLMKKYKCKFEIVTLAGERCLISGAIIRYESEKDTNVK